VLIYWGIILKLFYISIPIIFLFFVGCSSTYRVTDYPSLAKFHEDVNYSMKDRDVNVITVDSTFTSLKGSRIKDDSLQTVANIQQIIPLKDIKDIKYYGRTYKAPSATIWLKNGEELTTENVEILPDSSIQFINITNEKIPLTEVKQVSYTDHLKGAIPGLLIGTIVGGIIGYTGWIYHPEGGGRQLEFLQLQATVFGAVVGLLTGTIVGIIVGHNNYYIFSP
jgi:hypothetical protein